MKSLIAIFFLFFTFNLLLGEEGIKSQFIFNLQEKHVHSSSIVELPNGDFLACWFYGSGERSANDVLVQGARLKKGKKKWGPVFLMADTPGFPDCNPVLFVDKNKKLWMFWIVVQANRWENSILKYKTSTDFSKDGAPTWSWQDIIQLKPGEEFAETFKKNLDALEYDDSMWAEYAFPYKKLILEAVQDPIKRQLGWMTRTHPITLNSGRILVPLYSDGFNAGLMAISDDNGQTWRASKPLVGYAPIQPTVVQKKDGSLVAYMRDSGGAPNRALVSFSIDDGETWAPAIDSDIPNPGSSLEIIKLKSGNWAMAFNDTERGRHQIAVALSDNEGKSWQWKKYLDKAEPRKGGFAYPSIMQAKNGDIHVTYSYKREEGKAAIKHVVLTEKWLKK